MRSSSRARSTTSTRSRMRVSAWNWPLARDSARSSGSPDSSSTSCPWGDSTSAARSGTKGSSDWLAAMSSPNSTSSRTRCRTLRRPSRANQTPLTTDQSEWSTGICLQGGSALASELFLDARGLAGAVAEEIELGAADLAAALDLDLRDRRAVRLEHALDALAVRHLAHRERAVEAAVLARDHDALVGLHALAVALAHLDLHDDGVAGTEVRQLALHRARFQFLHQLVHDSVPNAVKPYHAAARCPPPCKIPRAATARPASARAAPGGRAAAATCARAPASGASAGWRHGCRPAAPAVPAGRPTLPAACSAASRGVPRRTSPPAPRPRRPARPARAARPRR